MSGGFWYCWLRICSRIVKVFDLHGSFTDLNEWTHKYQNWENFLLTLRRANDVDAESFCIIFSFFSMFLFIIFGIFVFFQELLYFVVFSVFFWTE